MPYTLLRPTDSILAGMRVRIDGRQGTVEVVLGFADPAPHRIAFDDPKPHEADGAWLDLRSLDSVYADASSVDGLNVTGRVDRA